MTLSFLTSRGVCYPWLCPHHSASRASLCLLPSFRVVSLFQSFYYFFLLRTQSWSSRIRHCSFPWSLLPCLILILTSHLLLCNMTCNLLKINYLFPIFSLENVSPMMVKILVYFFSLMSLKHRYLCLVNGCTINIYGRNNPTPGHISRQNCNSKIYVHPLCS